MTLVLSRFGYHVGLRYKPVAMQACGCMRKEIINLVFNFERS
jgi:hypothetical protein